MMECTKVDVAMERNYNYPKRLVRDAKIFAFIILLAAIGALLRWNCWILYLRINFANFLSVEYLLSIAFRVVYTKVHFGTLDGFLYYTNAFPQIFHSLPYSPISAALLQVKIAIKINLNNPIHSIVFLAELKRNFNIFLDLQRIVSHRDEYDNCGTI